MFVQYPEILTKSSAEPLLRILLELDPQKRLKGALGETNSSTNTYLGLRSLPFFESIIHHINNYQGIGARDLQQQQQQQEQQQQEAVQETPFSLTEQLYAVHQRQAIRVPTLQELCIKAVAKAALVVADAITSAGGFRPPIHWIQV